MVRRVGRRITAALAVLALLGACAPEPEPLRPGDARVLTLAVEQTLSDNARAGLEQFVQKVSELSGGTLTVSILPGDDVLAALDAGANLIFASNGQLARADGNFLSYSSPYYFYDYKHLSLTLNSDAFYDRVGERLKSLLGASPLGAFYDGNRALVSARNVTLDTLDQYQGLRIYVEEAGVFSILLDGLGAETLSRDQKERIEGFNRGRYPAVECDLASIGALRLPPNNVEFAVCESFHAARVNWLLISTPAYDALDETQRAVISEAVAYSIAQNDALALQAEDAARQEAEGQGAVFVGYNRREFIDRTDEILKNSERTRGLWDWDLHEELRQLAVADS